MGATKIRKTDITFVGRTLDIDTDGNFKLAGTAVTATAAELNKLDNVTATTDELNLCDAFVAGATLVTTGRSETADMKVCLITLQDLDLATVTGVRTGVFAYIAGDSDGTPTTSDSTMVISTTGDPTGAGTGTLIELVAYRSWMLISSTDGVIYLDVTKPVVQSTTGMYVNIVLPSGDRIDSTKLQLT